MLKVKIVASTPEPEKTVAAAARLCYSAASAIEILEDFTPEKVEKFISKLLEMGHESPLEHAYFTFAVEGVSRALSHQLVRHRIASYSQKSQRYVNEKNFTYIIPPSVAADPATERYYCEQMEIIRQAYVKLTQVVHREDARYILPNACETKIVVTMNARSLHNFFRLRCCYRAQWEIQQLALKMRREVREVAPLLFQKAGAPCESEGICPEGIFPAAAGKSRLNRIASSKSGGMLQMKEGRRDFTIGRRSVLESKAGELTELCLQQGVKGKIIDELISLAEERGIPWHWLERDVCQRLASGLQHQGVIGYLKSFKDRTPAELLQQAKRLNEPPFILILDHIQDAGNLGSLLRTAEAAGVHGVIIPSRRAASVSPAVRKAASGALSYLLVAMVVNLVQTVQYLQGEGLWIFGSKIEGGTPYYTADFNLPLALIVGNEEKGISRLLQNKCDYLLSLPMRGRLSSLNAAVAGALLVYEVYRQRAGWQM